MTSGDHGSVSFKEIILAGFVYFFCTLFYFFPTLPTFSTALIGPPEDNMQFYWFLWYGSGSFFHHGQPLMHTTLIYYPEGAGLFYANYYYYGVLLAVLLRPLLGLTAIFNFCILHSFIVAGIGAFILIKYLTGDFKSSLVGGFVFAFNPSHFAHALHHVTIASIQFVPFFVYFFIKTVRERFAWRNAMGSAFCLALGALCDWNYLVFGLVFIFLSYIYLAVRARRAFLKDVFKKIAVVFSLMFVGLSPLLVPMIVIGVRSTFKRDLPGHDIYVADLLGFFIPDGYHGLARFEWVRGLNGKMTGTEWEKVVYLGLGNLAVILAVSRGIWKQCRKYFLGLLAFMVLAMGVAPHVLGKSLPLPLPYRILQITPFFTNARNPSRIIVFAYLFLAILVAYAVRYLFREGLNNVTRKVAAALILAVLFFDFYSVAAAVTPVQLPMAYDQIRHETDKNFAILEVPWDGARYMMYQTIHGIPDVQGYLGRRVETTLAERLPFNPNQLGEQKKLLIENRVKYVVLHKKKMEWSDQNPKDRVYTQILRSVSQYYAKTYEKVYEDDFAATFKVY